MGVRTLVLAPLAGGLLLACGGPQVIDQAVSQTPLALANVAVTQTGDSDVAIPPGGITFSQDAARLLVVDVRLRFSGPQPRTVALRATVYDQTGRIVGDATGGAIQVVPGSEVSVELSGPTPTGTIAAVTVEVHTVPAPSVKP
ncbi:MAG TPA: hypothetical protein VF112_04765 [Candidatus Dormibacteraeota bacterium]